MGSEQRGSKRKKNKERKITTLSVVQKENMNRNGHELEWPLTLMRGKRVVFFPFFFLVGFCISGLGCMESIPIAYVMWLVEIVCVNDRQDFHHCACWDSMTLKSLVLTLFSLSYFFPIFSPSSLLCSINVAFYLFRSVPISYRNHCFHLRHCDGSICGSCFRHRNSPGPRCRCIFNHGTPPAFR